MRALIAICLFPIVLLLGTEASAQTSPDASGGSHDEIVALQHRLVDDQCYAGPIDGVATNALSKAAATCPPQAPQLRIETGMHSSTIWRIASDAACRIVATGSDDKTVRLWSMLDGRLLRTQRMPIGADRLGQYNAVAMSRDGTLIAAGGYDTYFAINGRHAVYVFDAATGQMIRRVGNLDSAIQEIAFSPDGSLIAVGALQGGVHLIDVRTGQEVVVDSTLKAPIEGLMFGPDGALYAVSVDGSLRRYAANTPGRKVATRGGRNPYSVAIDPTGQRIAVGFLDSPSVEEFDAQSLAELGFADTRDMKDGHFPAVTWAADGQTLFAAGYVGQDLGGAPSKRFVRRFNRDGTRMGDDIPVADGTIMGVAPCGNDVLFATGDPLFGIVQRDGATAILGRGQVADMRDKLGDAFQVSRDGSQVRFGLAFGQTNPVLADLVVGKVEDSPANATGLPPAEVTGLPVTNWTNSNVTKLGKRLIVARTDGFSRSLAIRPDRAGFVLGTSGELKAFDARGRELWRTPAFTEAWGLNLAQDGNLVVAALGDGTVRWYRWSDGKQLLALFVDKNDKRWVAWTPTGYYMASPGGEDLIGWHVNRGWTQPADFFPASRFRARFSRPDIVKLVLKTLDENEAVSQANAASRRKEEVRPLIAQLPPVIRIVGPNSGSRGANATVTVDYAWRSPSGLPVDRIAVLVNGHTVKTQGLPLHVPGKDTETTGSVTIALTERNNEVGLIAWSGDLSSQMANVKIGWDGAPATSSQDRKLYAVIAGVSNYADAAMALGFAAKDASDFAKALANQKGGYYGDVQTRLITDHAVTRESIVEGLEWLETNVTRKDDVGVLYLAGHGVTDDRQAYWYLPADATEDNFRVKGVSQDEMRRSLQLLPGKVLWFLDTCHAGGAAKRPVDTNVLVNAMTAPENGGIVTFASSAGSELSEERADWNNGAFTKAIVEGIAGGQAARPRDGNIMTLRLYSFLGDRVQELTDGKQHPVLGWPAEEIDFAIAQRGEPPPK